MEYFWSHFVLTVLSMLGAFKLVVSCYHSPLCEQASNNKLKTAVQQGNRTAVCIVLPLYMQCLEEALTKCKQELPQDLEERAKGTGTNVTKLQAALDDSKIKYRDSCFTKPYQNSNSARGDNGGCRNYSVVSLAGLIILSFIHDFV